MMFNKRFIALFISVLCAITPLSILSMEYLLKPVPLDKTLLPKEAYTPAYNSLPEETNTSNKDLYNPNLIQAHTDSTLPQESLFTLTADEIAVVTQDGPVLEPTVFSNYIGTIRRIAQPLTTLIDTIKHKLQSHEYRAALSVYKQVLEQKLQSTLSESSSYIAKQIAFINALLDGSIVKLLISVQQLPAQYAEKLFASLQDLWPWPSEHTYIIDPITSGQQMLDQQAFVEQIGVDIMKTVEISLIRRDDYQQLHPGAAQKIWKTRKRHDAMKILGDVKGLQEELVHATTLVLTPGIPAQEELINKASVVNLGLVLTNPQTKLFHTIMHSDRKTASRAVIDLNTQAELIFEQENITSSHDRRTYMIKSEGFDLPSTANTIFNIRDDSTHRLTADTPIAVGLANIKRSDPENAYKRYLLFKHVVTHALNERGAQNDQERHTILLNGVGFDALSVGRYMRDMHINDNQYSRAYATTSGGSGGMRTRSSGWSESGHPNATANMSAASFVVPAASALYSSSVAILGTLGMYLANKGLQCRPIGQVPGTIPNPLAQPTASPPIAEPVAQDRSILTTAPQLCQNIPISTAPVVPIDTDAAPSTAVLAPAVHAPDKVQSSAPRKSIDTVLKAPTAADLKQLVTDSQVKERHARSDSAQATLDRARSHRHGNWKHDYVHPKQAAPVPTLANFVSLARTDPFCKRVRDAQLSGEPEQLWNEIRNGKVDEIRKYSSILPWNWQAIERLAQQKDLVEAVCADRHTKLLHIVKKGPLDSAIRDFNVLQKELLSKEKVITIPLQGGHGGTPSNYHITSALQKAFKEELEMLEAATKHLQSRPDYQAYMQQVAGTTQTSANSYVHSTQDLEHAPHSGHANIKTPHKPNPVPVQSLNEPQQPTLHRQDTQKEPEIVTTVPKPAEEKATEELPEEEPEEAPIKTEGTKSSTENSDPVLGDENQSPQQPAPEGPRKPTIGPFGQKIWFAIKGRTNVITQFSVTKEMMKHTFSDNHENKGILALGQSKEAIMQLFVDLIKKVDAAGYVVEKSNEIRTIINGLNTTVRFYVIDGKIINVNGFAEFSGRVVGNLINFADKSLGNIITL